MIIPRIQKDRIKDYLLPNKVVVLLGARRTGKTVLLKEIARDMIEPYLILNGEDFSTHELLERRTVENYKRLLGNSKILFIDEAQKVPEIGKALKLMADEIDGLKIFVTGSSAFDISNKTGEPLTGRKSTHYLFPLSEKELDAEEPVQQKKDSLLQRLVYGSFPDVLQQANAEKKKEYLTELINSYLLKDILIYESLKNSAKILSLLKLIAFQIGKEVSLNELSRNLNISKQTVEKYLDLLSQTFIIYKRGAFSRNLRKEIVKNSKWYFYDNGVRNAVINRFNPLHSRDDVGELWENYFLSERIKFLHYSSSILSSYYWRTYDQQEIDLIEESDMKLYAYEIKWKSSKSKVPIAFSKAYPEASFTTVTSENYRNFLL